MQNTLQLLNKMGNMTISEKIDFIYKWHNGLALATDLQTITGDETFELSPKELDNGYLFENSKNQRVILNHSGDIEISDIGESPLFSKVAKQRLDKTEKMISMLEFKKINPAF